MDEHRTADIPDPRKSRAPISSEPPTASISTGALATPSSPSGAMQIGKYTVQSVLGEGGMGMVYLAQQESPRRLVALKVIRPGYLSDKMLRRFEFESQLLGRLQHPGIAQVYEAGMVEDERGRPLPFFAMEYIKGVSLTEHARNRKLGTRERLSLIARICDSVSHAHQKGIIHRDLKPGNILVDESGQPKILDFGVARATDGDIKTTTMQTDVGQLIGTVPYMSPEQVSGDPADLDTRSDVYALGVIAYELLAGRLPYDLQQKMIHEAVRVIREEEPTRLSNINKTLRGDVETIVAKALEKDKTRRYATAESLASDIRNYLADQPISARPASGWYQFQKFSRRNRGLVFGTSAAIVLLIAGVVGTSVGLKRAMSAEAQARASEITARAEATVSDQVTQFVVGSIQNASPQRRGPTATVAETLLASVGDIETQFATEPRVRERLHGAFADVYRGLNMYSESIEQLRRSLALAERREPHAPETVALRVRLGSQVNETGDYVAAAGELEKASAMIEAGVPADQSTRADIESSLGAIAHNVGDYALAEHHYRRLIGIESAAAADTPEEASERDFYVGIASDLLARLRIDVGDLPAGERGVREALTLKAKARGDATIAFAASTMTLAHYFHARGSWQEARTEYARAIRILRGAQQDDRAPIIVLAQQCLAGIDEDDPRTAATAAPDVEVLPRMRGLERMLVVQLRNRGRILITMGRVDEGLDRIRRAQAIDDVIGGAAKELSQAHTEKDAARALLGAGRAEEAAAFAEAALRRETVAGAADADTLVLLSAVERSRGNVAEAKTLAERARAQRATRVQHGVVPLAEAMLAEAAALEAAGNAGEAGKAADRAVAMLEPLVGAADPRVVTLRAIRDRKGHQGQSK